MPARVDFRNRPRAVETHLDDGAPICLRPIRPSDEEAIERGIQELSDRSRYLRFFSSFKSAPPSVVERLSAVDGFDHIAWGAVMTDEDGQPPVAAAHAIRGSHDSDTADLAIAVLDRYHDRGIARLLLAALVLDCRAAGLTELTFDILYANTPAITLVKSLGAETRSKASTVITYSLDVEQTLSRLKRMAEPRGLTEVFAAFETAPIG
ncbi:GNAT family N-acetyltransferase [Parasphingopyxis algicola]|uniref:GNAT family N-acetyltransferase n=1 Tax=Parasphingopyxis algicola TaxID=2026624 RepID=UPI0015A40C93|nr:GNAT family N-acetyltransferase [Parasphingopyxis algicola]QLC24262.1 GNAT family N-acetyltransferase [Parasphingopyxis algicola]